MSDCKTCYHKHLKGGECPCDSCDSLSNNWTPSENEIRVSTLHRVLSKMDRIGTVHGIEGIVSASDYKRTLKEHINAMIKNGTY